jgi:hypothetical protein
MNVEMKYEVDFNATLNTWNEMKLYGIDCSIEDD